MTIAPADFATPLCIAGEREGSVEDGERVRDGRKWTGKRGKGGKKEENRDRTRKRSGRVEEPNAER